MGKEAVRMEELVNLSAVKSYASGKPIPVTELVQVGRAWDAP